VGKYCYVASARRRARRLGAHGGREGRGHIVSPRAQLVPLIIGNTAFLSIAYSNADKYAEKYERYAIQNRTATHKDHTHTWSYAHCSVTLRTHFLKSNFSFIEVLIFSFFELRLIFIRRYVFNAIECHKTMVCNVHSKT